MVGLRLIRTYGEQTNSLEHSWLAVGLGKDCTYGARLLFEGNQLPGIEDQSNRAIRRHFVFLKVGESGGNTCAMDFAGIKKILVQRVGKFDMLQLGHMFEEFIHLLC